MSGSQNTAAGRTAGVTLTVADHEQNGFIALAQWPCLSEREARRFIANVDSCISDDAEPDIKTAAFTFILDLTEGFDTIDNGKRLLPMQVAMSLAPDEVRRWLDERPDPDSMLCRRIPIGNPAALASAEAVRS